jgi:hypothetical protein
MGALEAPVHALLCLRRQTKDLPYPSYPRLVAFNDGRSYGKMLAKKIPHFLLQICEWCI